MPGIVGLLTMVESEDSHHLLDDMSSSMMHETFYKKATHIDNSRGWFCGSVAFLGSSANCMPVYNEARDIVLLMAGECFCDRNTPVSFCSTNKHIAPEIVLKLYEQYGVAFTKYLNGWFSGVILDARRDNALLFTDRYGIQKLYTYYENDTLVFASEVKALLKGFPKLKNIEMKNIAEYICYDCVLNNRTYFSGIEILPGGHFLTYSQGKIKTECYFDPSSLEHRSRLNASDFEEQLGDTFKTAVSRYLGGEKTALALTGGMDTRLIMSCLPSAKSDTLTTLTYGGMYRDSRDVMLARKVAGSCGLDHNVIRLGSEFLSRYPEQALRGIYISDGMADVTTLDMVYLANCARLYGQTMVMGTFGSQVLGRVKRALRYRLPNDELFNEDFKTYINNSSNGLQEFQHEHNLTYVLKREIPWYWSRFSVPQMSQMDIRHPFLDNDFIEMLYSAPEEGYDGSVFEVAAIKKFNRDLLDIRTNNGEFGKTIPLLSPMIKNFIKYRTLTEKTLNWDILPYSLHHAVAKLDAMVISPLHLNKLFLGVQYFRHYNMWFRRELAGYLEDVLLNQKTLSRPYWNAGFIKKMVKEHIGGRKRYFAEIRKVLTIELIHRVFIEGEH